MALPRKNANLGQVINVSGTAVGNTISVPSSGTININGILNIDGLLVNGTGVSVSGHSHGNITSSGTIGSTSGLAVVTTSNGTITTSSNLSFDTNSLSINSRYTEKVVPVSIVSSGITLNLSSGNLFTTSLTSNITGVTISNPPSSSNTSIGFSWILTADGTGRTITWPSSVKWPGGSGPTLTATSGKIDVLSFLSTNNGTSYLGFIGGQNY